MREHDRDARLARRAQKPSANRASIRRQREGFSVEIQTLRCFRRSALAGTQIRARERAKCQIRGDDHNDRDHKGGHHGKEDTVVAARSRSRSRSCAAPLLQSCYAPWRNL
jgi:hypothetical protein